LKPEVEFFKNVIRFIYPEVTTHELKFLSSDIQIKSMKAKAYFIEPEKTHQEIGFVAKGLVRGFYIDANGNEVTTRFLKEGSFATHYKAFLLQQPSKNIIKILESRVESFQFENAEERYLNFMKQNPDLYNRISLSHLSTYLGIQRPSLSRIRKKIASL